MEAKVEAGTGSDLPPVPRDLRSSRPGDDVRHDEETARICSFWLAVGGVLGFTDEYEGAA